MIKQQALKYLGHTTQIIDDALMNQIDECIEEVKKNAKPRAYYQKYTLKHDPLELEDLSLQMKSKDLDTLFKNCNECIVIACSLGVEIDRTLLYYGKFDMSKATIMDAVASAYLEYYCDEYEEQLHLKNRTFRCAPGYGDIPLALNKDLATALQLHKHLGISLNENHLFVPMKSMLGLIGLGDNNQKRSCANCMIQDDCTFKRKGQTCYSKN